MNRTHAMVLAAALVGSAMLTPGAHATAGDDPVALSKAVEKALAKQETRRTFVMTDKPLYRPGEVVWFRAFELQAKTLAAMTADHGVTFQLFDPSGSKVMEKRVLSQAGVAANDFELPASIAGGKYRLRAASDLGAEGEREITVSVYELPQVKKSLEFVKKSYRPGDAVTAVATLQAATGEPLKGARVTALINVDGRELARLVLFSSEQGKVYVRFDLPPAIQQADASLTLLVDAGGQTESLQRRIPVLLDKVSLAAYPEGGDLVAGLPSRVYIGAKDTLGDPAEVEAAIVDEAGAVKASFKSFHAGMARASFTPEAGKTYRVKLSAKNGRQELPLPAPKSAGCVLQVEDDYRSAKPDIGVGVRCTVATKAMVTGVLRERLIAAGAAVASPGKAVRVALAAPDAVGAVRITLFDEERRPLAERLVYRGLGGQMKVTVTGDRPSYSPRDPVTLTITTEDRRGAPVAADVALAVVDDTVLSFADDKSGHILAKLYLEPEMPGQKVVEPNFYFSADPKAPEAMDLLLGTQGWRRFDWQLVK